MANNRRFKYDDKFVDEMSKDELVESVGKLIDYVLSGDHRVYNEKRRLRKIYGQSDKDITEPELPESRSTLPPIGWING